SNVDLSKLTDADKRELQQFAVNETQKAQLQQAIHSLTDTCFRKCVTSKISSGQLDKYEQPCVQNCVDRFLDANRVILGKLEMLK
ncbi:hypothetical protein K490DRAFT_17164, partial [Saccharata proteae CBS 121410]